LSKSASDEYLPMIAELVEYTNDTIISNLSSIPTLAPRQYAGATLARCNRLLGGMLALYASGFPDLLGVQLRLVLEFYFVGEYLILAPDEAYDKLLAAHKDQLSRMGNGGWEDLQSVMDEIPQKSEKLNLFNVMSRVGELAEAADVSGSQERMAQLYEVIYRGESLMNVHVGIGSLTGHIEDGPSFLSARAIRREPDDPAHTIRMAAVLVGNLAHDVARHFGISTDKIARLTNQIGGGGA
jgi:predicted Zn-dependent protease with MMP-like domain